MSDSDNVVLRPKSEKYTKNRPESRIQSLQSKNLKLRERLKRQDSIGAIEELVQCGICLEKLTDGRMLPCQHTFCLCCLQSHVVAKTIMAPQSQPPTVEEIQTAVEGKNKTIRCPVCQHRITLEKGFDSIEKLPKNLYIDSLLKVVEGDISFSPTKTPDYRCVKCQTYSEGQEQICQHCIQVFCNVCWNQHLSELESNLSTLVKQVEESKVRLEHKLENFENRCDQLIENVAEATLQKIDELKLLEARALTDVTSLKSTNKALYEKINARSKGLMEKLLSNSFGNGSNKVVTFMNLHRETSDLLKEVNLYGEARVIFDPESFKLDQDTEGTYADTEDIDQGNGSKVINPLESIDSMSQYYKTRSFDPKLIWNKCPRPANVGVPPWDQTLIYVAATDTHTVLILNRDKSKLVGRLAHANMLYPQGIAFSKTTKEIYISDKWQHCIHVFSHNNEVYLRSICSKGIGDGMVRSPDGIAIGPKDELVICDTGNDRVIIVNPQNGEHLATIGIVKGKTKLNMPTGVAVYGEQIVVTDTGNHRIKIFNFNGEKQSEFGALGRSKGQFRSAEVVTVDPKGFILVGDGGNARIQVFRPDGTLVKAFGGLRHGNDGFGWVSGICVTNDLDIITTDRKTKTLLIF